MDKHPDLYDVAAETIGKETPATILEFGVAHGRSMRLFSERFTSPDTRFTGFDSFVGLPEAWLMHDAGAFSNRGVPPAIPDQRVSFVKGWFQNTVPDYLDRFEYDPVRPYLIHYDADLYSSTLFLLTSMWCRIPEYYFIMDDFTQDDMSALFDFAVAYPVELEFIAQTRGSQGSELPVPAQVFGRTRRVEFEPTEPAKTDQSQAPSAKASSELDESFSSQLSVSETSGFHPVRTGTLDTLGILAGTDKSSLGNNYLHYYESLFERLPIRAEAFDFVEIGVFKGKSLKLWENYFSNARIIGVDINPECRQFAGGRVIVEIGSQADTEFLDELAGRYRPFIIIDDGSHIVEHIQRTFEKLYPSLCPGGYYIIEDTYMHFGANADAHRGNTTVEFGDYFSNLALTNMRQWIEGDTTSRAFKNYWFNNTESISFAKSVITIRKKPETISADTALSIVDRYCETEPGRSPEGLFGSAGVILGSGGSLDKAEALMSRAIAMAPEIPEFHYRLSEIFHRQERFGDASASLSKAAELAPNDPLYWDRLARLHARRGSYEQACAAMQKALALFPNPHCYHFLGEILRKDGRVAEAIRAFSRAIELARGMPITEEWERELQSLTAVNSDQP